MNKSAHVLEDLMAVIQDRKTNPPPHSYTTSLFEGGVEMIGEKILEEAREVVDAVREADGEASRSHLTHEAADLMYHLLVMLGFRGVPLADVNNELGRRFGISGLDEKAARGTSPS